MHHAQVKALWPVFIFFTDPQVFAYLLKNSHVLKLLIPFLKKPDVETSPDDGLHSYPSYAAICMIIHIHIRTVLAL